MLALVLFAGLAMLVDRVRLLLHLTHVFPGGGRRSLEYGVDKAINDGGFGLP